MKLVSFLKRLHRLSERSLHHNKQKDSILSCGTDSVKLSCATPFYNSRFPFKWHQATNRTEKEKSSIKVNVGNIYQNAGESTNHRINPVY